MPLYSYHNFKPECNKTNYIAPGAMVIGRVFLGENVSLWHNCVLRGDVNEIRVGKNSNIQDLSMCHVTEDFPLTLGENVTIGHSVTLHGCTIGDNALIGMGATLLDRCKIGSYSIVAAGSTVPPNKEYPEGVMIMGTPAKVVRPITEAERKMLDHHYQHYMGYAKDFMQNTKLL